MLLSVVNIHPLILFLVSWNHLDPLEQLGRTLLIVIAVLLMMLFALLVISVHSIVCNRTPSKVPSKVAIQRHAHSHITTTAAATTIATISASIPDMPLTSPITETATTPTETPEEETDAGASFGGGDFSTPRPTSDSYSSNPFTVAAAVAAVSAIPDIPLMGHVAETAIIPTETSEEETEAGAFFGGDDFSTPRPTSDSYSSNSFTTVADRMPDILMSPVAGPATIPIETSEEETEADASFGGGDFSTPRSASDSIAGTAITDAIPSNTSKEVTIARSSSQKCPGHVFSPRSSTAAVSMSSVFSNLTNVGYVGKERSARSTSSGGLRHPAMVVSGGVGREGMLFNTADDPVDLTYGFRDAQIDEPSSRPRQGHVGGLIASGLWGRR